ncbi:right-handed parallel beta-helix repeat-containing protein [Bacteroidota bacterium]
MKAFIISVSLVVLALSINSQEWVVYDGSISPDVVFDSSGTGILTDTIITDPDIDTNKLYKYEVDGSFNWRANLVSGLSGITFVAKVKGDLDPSYHVVNFNFRNGKIRPDIRIEDDKINPNGTAVNLNHEIDMTGWHLIRITLGNDSSLNVYVDEKPSPVMEDTATYESSDYYLQWGDGSGGDNYGGLIDWIIFDTTGVYAPGDGAAIPDSLSTEYTCIKPDNLIGTLVSDSQVDLSWDDNSDNELGFIIERKTVGEIYSVIDTVNANLVNYTDLTIDASLDIYYYRIKAYNESYHSGYSNDTNFSSKITVEGNVYGNWTKDNSPYVITNDITIPDDSTLTIEPGVIVVFAGYYYLQIDGTLKAEGLENDSILFTIIDNNGFSDMYDTTGGWQGIIISGSNDLLDDNDSSILKYCIFEYAKGTSYRGWADGGALYIHRTDNVRIENSDIRNNSCINDGGGIALGENAHIILKNSIIHDNKAIDGGGIDLGKSSYALIKDNKIYNNTASTYGGGIYSQAGESSLINNIIANNYSSYDGGGIYILKSFNTYIGNIIVNNEAANRGGAILINSDLPDIINHTICNNKSNYGGGIMIINGGTPTIINTVLWGNSSTDNSQINIGAQGVPNFYNCILQDGKDSIEIISGFEYLGEYLNNIDSDPQFINPSEGSGINYDGLSADWRLISSSPCLNNGSNELAEQALKIEKDIYKNTRVIYAIIDIGASETNVLSLTVSDSIKNDTSWIADSVFVDGDIFIKDNATLTIAPGAVVVFQGYFGITVEGVLIAHGTENNKITFTVNDTAGFSNVSTSAGSWKGIELNGYLGNMWDNDTTKIDHCIIQYANAYANGEESGGGIRISKFSKIIISNSVLKNNIAKKGGGINITQFSNPIIKNNIFFKNQAVTESGGGLAIYTYAEPLIVNNIISNNSSSVQGGGLRVYQANPKLINNVFCNNYTNSGGGVSISQGDDVIFINNTIVNNYANYYGGIRIINCNPDIINSISWGNEDLNGNIQFGATENSALYNCIVENAEVGGISFDNIPGELVNIFDINPDFINPSNGPGLDYDGLMADYSISDLSPAINAGDPDLLGDYFPIIDINGNPRIRYEGIDIGAYENSGHPLQIITQPIHQKVCEGDSVSLSFNVEGIIEYQWKKNNDTIPGAIDSLLIINPINTSDEANYSCIITNGYGSVETNNVYITVQTSPNLLIQPKNQKVCSGDSAEFNISVIGAAPITYQWYFNDSLISGADNYLFKINNTDSENVGLYSCITSNICGDTYSDSANLVVFTLPQIDLGDNDTICWNEEYILDPGDFELYRWNDYTTDRYKTIEDSGSYYVRVTDVNGCKNYSDTITISIQQAHIPEIHLVTVDRTENKNLIVWGKHNATNIISYNIYKETSVANEYKQIGTRTYNDSNIFVDRVSEPEVKADRYKISVVDNCGETDLSAHHKTIHLSPNERAGADNAVNLIWNHYEGFEFGSYILYRGTAKNDLEILDTIASTNYSYSDLNVPADVDCVYYRIQIERDDTVYLEIGKRKAEAGPYAHTVSNMEDNRLRSTENSSPTEIQLSSTVIFENLPVGRQIGVFTASDEDIGDDHIYTIISGDDYFDIEGSTLVSGIVFDYEATEEYTITIQVVDSSGATYQKDFTIQILNDPENVNAVPSDIQITINRIEENLPIGSQVGILFTTDDDATHTYTILSNNDGDDYFDISGSSLLTKVIFDYNDQSEYTIRIRTTDPGGETFEKDITIYIKSTTGIEMNSVKKQLLVYPNPVKDILYIKHDLNNINEYSISIFNSVGYVVYYNTYFENEIEINIVGLYNGLYIIRFSYENQTTYKRFTIIK